MSAERNATVTTRFVPLNLDDLEEIIGGESDLVSRDALLRHERLRTTDTVLRRLVALTGAGQAVAYGFAVTGPWDPILEPQHFQVHVHVLSPWRRRGIGGALYQASEHFALEHAGIAVEGSVADSSPDNMAWAEHRGFVRRHHSFGSRLNLDAFNPQICAAASQRVAALGVRYVSVADYMSSDGWFERYIDFYFGLAEDVPGMQGRLANRPDLRYLEAIFTEGPHWEPAGIILGVLGNEWVVLAALNRQPDGDYYNQMTGVPETTGDRGSAWP